MSNTSCASPLAPLRWLRAGGDPSQPITSSNAPFAPPSAQNAYRNAPGNLSIPLPCTRAARITPLFRPPPTSALSSNPHSARCQPVPNFPRLRALALFGRRPPERVVRSSLPASENLHRSGLLQRSNLGLFDHLVGAAEQGRWHINFHANARATG